MMMALIIAINDVLMMCRSRVKMKRMMCVIGMVNDGRSIVTTVVWVLHMDINEYAHILSYPKPLF